MSNDEAASAPKRNRWPTERYAAMSAIASAISALAAAAGLVLAALALNASQAAVSVAQRSAEAAARGQMLKDVDEAISRLLADRTNALYFMLVMKNVADYRRAHILSETDIKFIGTYLMSQKSLCRHGEIIKQWKALQEARLTSDELRSLVEPLIAETRQCDKDGTLP